MLRLGLPLHRQVNGEMNGNQQINRPTGDDLHELTYYVDKAKVSKALHKGRKNAYLDLRIQANTRQKAN